MIPLPKQWQLIEGAMRKDGYLPKHPAQKLAYQLKQMLELVIRSGKATASEADAIDQKGYALLRQLSADGYRINGVDDLPSFVYGVLQTVRKKVKTANMSKQIASNLRKLAGDNSKVEAAFVAAVKSFANSKNVTSQGIHCVDEADGTYVAKLTVDGKTQFFTYSGFNGTIDPEQLQKTDQKMWDNSQSKTAAGNRKVRVIKVCIDHPQLKIDTAEAFKPGPVQIKTKGAKGRAYSHLKQGAAEGMYYMANLLPEGTQVIAWIRAAKMEANGRRYQTISLEKPSEKTASTGMEKKLRDFLAEDYGPLAELKYVADPHVSGTYAVQGMRASRKLQFLIRNFGKPGAEIEEVEFKTWPPQSR